MHIEREGDHICSSKTYNVMHVLYIAFSSSTPAISALGIHVQQLRLRAHLNTSGQELIQSVHSCSNKLMPSLPSLPSSPSWGRLLLLPLLLSWPSC